MSQERKPDLYKMKLPGGLKKLNIEQCDMLCDDIRQILIETVSKNGGHLASNLGTVELTMAVHRVFDSPRDKIVWDVGHQSYTHKILTGRLNKFDTLRQENGISGFCRPEESVHDAFISGHSSNSVSAALGIATAMKIKGDKHHSVAIFGDGAFSGGLLYEGLNNAGKSGTNLVIILNYNEMSISKSVGGMSKYLSTLRTKDSYYKTKNAVENALNVIPVLGRPVSSAIKSSKKAFKNLVLNSTMFEDLGFAFIGPLDGHNIEELENGLLAAKALNKPVFVHVNTVKGKGYEPAEANPGEYHGVGSFEITTGNPDVVTSNSFSSVFGKELVKMAQSDNKICAITAAMKYGTGLQYFYKAFPDRFFDVGIAEEHAITFCGGLSSMGMIPVFAVYSSFLQRAYDELLHDLAICNYHVVLGVDRVGIVGEDGSTHQGIFDICFLTTIPNTTIYSPSTYDEVRLCLHKAVEEDTGIVAVRYPRGEDKSASLHEKASTNYVYKNNGNDVLVITYGRLYNNVVKAREVLHNKGIKVDTLKLVKIFPIQEEIIDIIANYKVVFFFEEAYHYGSMAEKYCAFCGNIAPFTIKNFVEHGDANSLLDKEGLSADKMVKQIEELLNNEKKN